MGTALMSNDSASCPYEIGDGFWTKNPTPPSERWPGTTWEQLKDTFLLSSGNTYSVGQTGGESAHTLTVEELAQHGHTLATNYNPTFTLVANGSNTAPLVTGQSIGAINSAQINGFGVYANITGSSQPHNNMPPYTVRSYWERTG